jgi:hypothetical protein
VLVEESLIGWDEFELEVMRDLRDNVVIVCSIENLDPMGVHTGDSVTVAPQMTLPDEALPGAPKRGAAVIRAVGVETGGSNIQFARERETGELRVIEMNPRVSRSSALASKATGYPIAKVAAKLAVGYTLDEIPNDLTGRRRRASSRRSTTSSSSSRASLSKSFRGADETLGTQMKSVGEAMGIGRTFTEAFLKAMRSRELDGGAATPWRALDDVPRRPSLVPRASSSAQRGLAHATESDLVATTGSAEARAGRTRTSRRAGHERGATSARGSLGRQARLPARRLVRGRGRGGSNYLYSTWGEEDEARRPGSRSSSSARARTGSARGSSSTTAASTRRRPSARSATRP